MDKNKIVICKTAKATSWVMLLFHVLLRAVIQVSISTLEIGRFKKATTISNVKMPTIIFLLKVDFPYIIVLSSVCIFLLITLRKQLVNLKQRTSVGCYLVCPELTGLI